MTKACCGGYPSRDGITGGLSARLPLHESTMNTASSTAPLVKLAIISEGIYSWPLYVAQERRLFERAGIDVHTTLTGSSVQQLEQLNAGAFDIGFQQADHVVRSVERGGELFIFMAQAHAPELSLVAGPGIVSFDDLRGRDIAVDGARTGYALLLRKLLADQGLDEGDYAFSEVGGSRERYDALRSGATCASLLNPPFDRNLLAEGFNSLGTTGEYFPGYPGPIAAARRSWAQRNTPRLLAFISAFNDAYRWLTDPANKADAIGLLPHRLGIAPDTAARVYDELASRPRPGITPDSLRQVIDIVWQSEGLRGPPGSPSKYLDMSYYEKTIH